MNPKVRVTAILIEAGRILLLEQKVTESLNRGWSLPGGGLELNESVGDCLVREMKEETGLDVALNELLYVCDRIQDGRHVVHLTFLVEKTGGRLARGFEPEKTANPIQNIEMVPLERIEEYGFTKKFKELALSGFPNRGAYLGPIENIGL